jgi:hypothetical protein
VRTTVTLEPDLFAALKRRAAEQGVPFKDVLNRTLRAGLSQDPAARPQAFQQRTVALHLRPGLDLDRAGRLADDLEDAERVRKLELRK